MRKIGLYSKSINDQNLKFIKKLVDCIREEIAPQLLLHENLVNIPSLYDPAKDQVFSGFGQNLKIMLSPRRELSFRGSRHSEITPFSYPFCMPAASRPETLFFKL